MVVAVHLGGSVTFSAVGAAGAAAQTAGGADGSKRPMVADGVNALTEVLTTASSGSTAEAVAAHTLFLHPDTVAQTEGQAVFPVVRDMHKWGRYAEVRDRQVLLDDNTSATLAFLWSAQRRRGNDVQTGVRDDRRPSRDGHSPGVPDEQAVPPPGSPGMRALVANMFDERDRKEPARVARCEGPGQRVRQLSCR